MHTTSPPGTENLQQITGGETEQTELVVRVLSATVIYKKEWQCQFYQVCKMKKPQSLGLVWEQKNHSASQPQPAFYFSVTLQSISPFPALLSARDTSSHSTGVAWYPKKPNHKQSNIFPFRSPSPHKHTCMRGAPSGMPGEPLCNTALKRWL